MRWDRPTVGEAQLLGRKAEPSANCLDLLSKLTLDCRTTIARSIEEPTDVWPRPGVHGCFGRGVAGPPHRHARSAVEDERFGGCPGVGFG